MSLFSPFRRATTSGPDTPPSQPSPAPKLSTSSPLPLPTLPSAVLTMTFEDALALEDVSLLKAFVKELQDTLDATDKLCIHLSHERNDVAKRDVELQKKVSQQGEEMALLKEQVGNASEMIVRNDEDYQLKQKQTSEAHAHDLRMIKEGYEQAIKELEGDLAASENALAAARRELSQLKQHNAELSEKCSSQLAFLSKADKEKNALEGKIGDIQSGKAGEVVELNEQIVKITQRKAELHSQVVELEQKLETSQSEIAKYKKESSTQKEEIKQLRQEVADLTTDTTHLKTKLRAYLEKELAK